MNVSSSFQVCQSLIDLSMKHDWDAAYEQVPCVHLPYIVCVVATSSSLSAPNLHTSVAMQHTSFTMQYNAA